MFCKQCIIFTNLTIIIPEVKHVSKNKQDRSEYNEVKRNVKKEGNVATPNNDMEISSEFKADKKDTKKKK